MRNFKGKTLLVFGDSIMYGSGNNGMGIGEYLSHDLGFSLEKYCIGGARVGYYPGKNWVVGQVRSAVRDGISADYIVFDGFTNDCNMTDGRNCDVPLGEITDGYEKFDIFAVKEERTTFTNCFENIAHAFRKYFPRAKLLFVRPHNMGRRDDYFQRLYGERALELCKKWGIAVADIYSNSDLNTFDPDMRDKYTNDSYGWGRGDATHPNSFGYTEKYMPIIEEVIKTL